MLAGNGMEGKKALIMTPTRELAVQIEMEARTLLSGTALKCASFYGGVGYTKQTSLLKKGVDILVGTPGRVIDLADSRQMDLSQVAFLVIDEADRMFDMGFYPDLRTLIKKLPKSGPRQTMLFSATLNTYVKNLAWEYTTNAEEITIESENVTVDEIDQFLYHVSSADKMKLLLGLLAREKPASVLVFCNTKKSCEIVAKRLRLNGIESEFIIGDLPQSKRLQVLGSFKAGSLTTLVATDVAARGIDVDDLAMVVNYDLPNESENYVHRIGRTARAGKSGKAYTFCSEQDVYNLTPIERFIGMNIPSSMADEELFAEDKSANVYIKLDNYDDRDERGFGRGERRDSERPPRFGAPRGPRSRDEERSGRERPGRGRDSRGRDAPRAEKSRPRDFSRKERRGPEKTAPRQNAAFDQEMLGLSLDERMKLYKEKYGGPGAASGRSASGSAGNGRSGSGGRRASGAVNAAGGAGARSGSGGQRGTRAAQTQQKKQAAKTGKPQRAENRNRPPKGRDEPLRKGQKERLQDTPRPKSAPPQEKPQPQKPAGLLQKFASLFKR
jgi:ATP-dependent RNA helicase RhlB